MRCWLALARLGAAVRNKPRTDDAGNRQNEEDQRVLDMLFFGWVGKNMINAWNEIINANGGKDGEEHNAPQVSWLHGCKTPVRVRF